MWTTSDFSPIQFPMINSMQMSLVKNLLLVRLRLNTSKSIIRQCIPDVSSHDEEKQPVILFLLPVETLEDLLKREKFFLPDEVHAQFYMMESTFALNYSHHNSIDFEDLKSKNAMIDRDVHINLSARVNPSPVSSQELQGFSTSIIVPNVYSEDWYSLVPTLNQMLGRPFIRTAYDLPAAVLERLSMTNKANKSINKSRSESIQALIEGRPNEAPLTIKDVVSHEWLNGIDWLSVERREHLLVYLPDVEAYPEITMCIF
ncbi:hypothetical protein CROQUDRAFT_110193 [Cronartium quercuum f. sp. fusiforme G11]|uniref:non-specific serine/threonine protein kinase n=1 Tax=Cronartium quercuum f. sp. fusiforme G11 TaxID=708437 RepID=A0A9P6T7U9_9BASI|nr:hypothetical protein CROQUDRAFT_110193 [Cronartium quercuum f. sp. fusiforme G11]